MAGEWPREPGGERMSNNVVFQGYVRQLHEEMWTDDLERCVLVTGSKKSKGWV